MVQGLSFFINFVDHGRFDTKTIGWRKPVNHLVSHKIRKRERDAPYQVNWGPYLIGRRDNLGAKKSYSEPGSG